MIYIISGFCAIKSYRFVYVHNKEEDVQNMLTLSLVVGFIICNVAYLIPFSFGETIDNIGIVAFSIVLGFSVGKVMNDPNVNLFLGEKLKIRRTTNSYLWNDIMAYEYIM